MKKAAEPPAISKLAEAFACYGAKQIPSLMGEDFAYASVEDPRRSAGIDFLPRTQPAALVTFILPKLGPQGFAIGERHYSVAFTIPDKKAFSQAATAIERAFWEDTRRTGATGLQVMSLYFVAEPPEAKASIEDLLPVSRRVEAANDGVRLRGKPPRITFDRSARLKEADAPLEGIDETVRRFATHAGLFLRHRHG